MEFRMKIGIPREIKNNENRVGLVPGGARQLIHNGHEVYVETNAGIGIGILDDEYIEAGAKILPSLEAVFETAEMIIKVKEPQPREIALLRSHHILYTYLHLAADKELTEGLMKSKSTCIAYETIQNDNGELPLLVPMSEVAGRMATQVGANCLQLDRGGKGVLLGGVPGVGRSRVTVIGCGVAGTNAIKMAMGLGADVVAIDRNPKRLAELDDLFETRITTLHSNIQNIEDSVLSSDLVIGAVLVAGAKAPKLVTKELIGKMEKGSVVVDIAVDQGGCIETCKPTTHEDPIYEIDGVIHYCVANMPGAVPFTSTLALTNATLSYALQLANKGWKKACADNPELQKGLNISEGKIVYKAVADAFDLEYEELVL